MPRPPIICWCIFIMSGMLGDRIAKKRPQRIVRGGRAASTNDANSSGDIRDRSRLAPYGPLLASVDASHSAAVLAVVTMNGLFLTGLTYRVITKRFAVA